MQTGISSSTAKRFVLGYFSMIFMLVAVFAVAFLSLSLYGMLGYMSYLITFILGAIISIPTLFIRFKLSDVDPGRVKYEVEYGFMAFLAVGVMQIAVYMMNGFMFKTQSVWQTALIALVAPVPEELLFCGLFALIFMVSKGRHRFWTANIVPSIIFVIFHLYVYGYAIATGIVLFASRTIFNYSYYRTRDLSVPTLGHFMENAMALIAGGGR